MQRIVHPGDWAALKTYLQSKPQQPQLFTQRWYGRNGQETWVELEPHPLYDEAGELAAFAATARDVTAQHETDARLRESEERFRLFTEQAEDIIFRVHLVPELRWEYISPALKRVTGFTPEELKQLRAAYKLLQHSKLNTADALAAIRERIASGEFGEKVAYLADFIAKSERGIIK